MCNIPLPPLLLLFLLQVIAVCKSADMLLMVLDATKPWSHKEILTRELESVGMRLNREPPNIYFKQKRTGME